MHALTMSLLLIYLKNFNSKMKNLNLKALGSNKLHDPVLAGWCMVVTTKSMVETTQKQPSNRFKNTVVTRLLLAWNNQPIFALEQPCFWVVTWLEFL